ncbi:MULTISPECIES: efflux transporter outer membrane subunit [Serratia]|uniref:efflux transporter outer membrane subunit n=1 Tax=Serratia TaxID=613 RepID=UPI00216078FE|nr:MULTISPECIES: efflux transporter outer membrane subunit [Serratia]MDI9108812.1 efflux transporter outer membrane subunit [Serratia marcescens]MDR8489233.1 efflux transporter outer membrane subunit [Serratia nevei]MDR8534601.1 efflux transporter outer membrane subunit [Serratia nevei]
MSRLWVFGLVMLSLSACGWRPIDATAPPSLPPQWRVVDERSGSLRAGIAWWENFNDPQLSALIDGMLIANQDLALAGLQWREAMLEAGLAQGNLTPDLAANLSGRNTRALRGATTPLESYRAGLSLSYEVDLWGKLARIREQAEWQAVASALDRRNTALTLIGATARGYWQIADLNQQVIHQQRMVTIARETLRLVAARHTAGDVGRFELLQAEQNLLARENQLHELERQREDARNSLALLFGRSPLLRYSERRSLPLEEVAIAQRLPAAVIARRPDVQAAERRLRAALAGAEAARLSFYPALSLEAGLDAGSGLFRRWFSEPSRSLGATLTLPFIEWRKMRLSSDKAALQAQRAEIQFRDAVYRALADVDNAMRQRLEAQRQIGNQRRHLAMSRQAVALARHQYQAGSVALQTLLDAQEAVLTSENSLSALQYRYLNATMQLWLALGGNEAFASGQGE